MNAYRLHRKETINQPNGDGLQQIRPSAKSHTPCVQEVYTAWTAGSQRYYTLYGGLEKRESGWNSRGSRYNDVPQNSPVTVHF